jgi:hypothetical protein
MENTVAGRILVEETDQGVADLLVVIYDIDPVVSKQLADAGVSGDDAIDNLYAAVPAARTWLDFPGDRIGSVLTDRQGRFRLSFGDNAFRVRNSEKRPDLVLFVLGPDRAIGSTFIGSPVISRLLHYAFIPRVNAGRVEHYVIAINPERLREKGVFLASRQLTPDAYLLRERRQIQIVNQIKTHTASLIREQLEPRAEIRTQIRNFRTSIGHKLLRPEIANAPYYVERGQSTISKQYDAIVSGINNIANLVTRGGIKLWLNPSDLLRNEIDPDLLATGETVRVSVCDLLAQKGLSGELVRIRRLLDEKQAQRQSRQLITPEQPSPPDVPEPDNPEPDISGDPNAFITSRILGQLVELPELKPEKSNSTIEELQKIKNLINKLELSGGPANVTAFHDFNTLQVAFQDVWTAAFDDRLRDQVLDLYRQTVAIHDEYGLEVPPMDDIADANALREYLANLRNETQELQTILPIPADVQECFPQLDLQTWNRLDEDGRNVLRTAALNFKLPWSSGNDINPPVSEWTSQEYLDKAYETAMKYHLNSPLAKAEKLILQVAERLNEPYSFKYFAPGTINYGILVTYRQEWIPESYQVGRLVSTLPLAPGEERKLKVTRKVHKTRAEKAIEKALVESTTERQFTSRTELDVLSKVVSSTNFRMTATGSLSIGIGQISSTSEFAYNQQQESSQQQKQFMEALQKSAERVRQETEITVETNENVEEGIESDTVLKNPNNELTVTYLLYELERRYRITSRPHRLTPVILVAMDIPAPHEITEGWILEHSWILKRVLLDDQFLDAIFYIENGLTADDIDINIKKANWDTQQETLSQLESDLERLLELRNERQDTIVRLLGDEKLAKANELDDGQRAALAIFTGGISELFGGGTSDRDELIKARREAAEKALEYLKGRVDALSERVSLARKAFSDAGEEYSIAVKNKARKDSQISQFKLHLRQNILPYMHGIWDYKHHDHLFFELNDLEVPFLESATRNCRLRRATPDEIESSVPGLMLRDGDLYIASCDLPIPPASTAPLPKKRLGTVADLNRPLGYKGNYIIYPLKGCSYITDFMSQDYVDDYFGLRDPATNLGYTGEELLAYASEVINDPESPLSESERDALIQAVAKELTNPTSSSETVILPTGQLYMEALKGEQSLLEDFKLAHRGLDVLKVQEEVRQGRLENCRRGLRMVGDPPDLEDPVVAKTVWFRDGRGVRNPIDVDDE